MKNRYSARLMVNSALAALGATLGSPANAAWEAAPLVQITAQSDDNVRLLQEGQPLAGGADSMSLDARLRATSTGTRGNLYIEPRVRVDEYTGDQNEDLNGADFFLRTRGGYNWTQAAFSFAADFDRQDLKDAELTEAIPDNPDIDDPIDPDTGLVVVDEDRQRVLLLPSLSIRMSDRSSLVLGSQIFDISYTGTESRGRVDFTDTRVFAGINRRVDERNQVSARLIAAEYEAELISNLTKTFGVEGTFDRVLTRDWRFSLGAGVNRSDYSFLNSQLQAVDNADTSFTYRVGLRQRGERNTVNIDLSREAAPNSTGFLTLRDQFRVFVSRAFTERLRGRVGIRANATKTLDDVVADDDRDYVRADIGLEWAFTEELFISGGYAFTSQVFGDAGEDASSNQVFLGFAYRARTR
jgi:hypothetical protein